MRFSVLPLAANQKYREHLWILITITPVSLTLRLECLSLGPCSFKAGCHKSSVGRVMNHDLGYLLR